MPTFLYSPIRVIIADDHAILRDGFETLFKKQKDMELVGEAENGKEVLELAARLKPDVVIMDIKMPVMDGIEATKILTEKYPAIGIIALTMFDEDNLIIDMLEAGAKGYMVKNASKEEIIEAVKAVHKQNMYYCRHTSTRLIQIIAKSKFNPYKKTSKPEFTAKEIEIIKLICEGFSNKEIASNLHLSIRTIEGHRESVHEKINVKNTAGIVVYAIKNGIYKI